MMKYLVLLISLLLISKICYSQISEINHAAKIGDLGKVIALLDSGANLNERDEENFTPLLSAAFHLQDSIAKYLIARGANLNVENNYGWTVLMSAALKDSIGLLSYYIGKGADVNYVSKFGFTALDKALHQSTKDFLISFGAKNGFDLLNPDQSKFKRTKDGKQGYWEIICFDGTFVGKGNFKNDVEDGYWKYYNAHGLLDSEGSFKKG